MDWTPDSIRDKAAAMERRLGQPVSAITRDTLQIVVLALRFYAEALERREPDAYVVDAWCGLPDVKGQVVAKSDKLPLAKAAYDAMCAAEPRYRVTLRQGGRVIDVRDSSTVDW